MMPKVKQLINPDLEADLLAAALQDCQHFALDVAPGDFHNELYRQIWGVGQELLDLGDYFDHVAVADVLDHRGVEYGTFLDRLAARDVNIFDARIWAPKVKDLASRRRLKTYHDALGVAFYTGNGATLDEADRIAAEIQKFVAERKAQIAPSKPQRITAWTAAELLTTDFPEPQWAVPGLVPVGLTFLAGRPKVGKSWLALQTAIAVSTGGMVLDRRVTQGKVLYIALEDNGRRLKERVMRQGMPSWATIRFETSWPRLTDNGLSALDAAIAEGYSLVVLDTLGRALGRADQSDLADMTEIVGALQEMAMTHDMAIIVIDHHRKPSGFYSDPIDDIVGSTAKSAVADCALGLTKEQGKRGATLKVTGRDVEWQDLALSWDASLCCWQYEGTTEEVQLQGRKGDVLSALRDGEGPMTLTDIARVTDLDKRNVQPILNDLVTEGRIERLAKVGRDVPYKLHVA